MITYALMGLLLAVLATGALVGLRTDENAWWTPNYTKTLKGLFCIIVVLVHTPAKFQNPIQDMMGSFAYIGVTFFFMASAYGLKYGYEHKSGYLKCFWRNRLCALLVPVLLANVLFVLLNMVLFHRAASWGKLLQIGSWVQVLILYYILFYITCRLFPGKNQEGARDGLLCALVVLTSLLSRFTSFRPARIWPTECMGFAYGILLARYFEPLKQFVQKKTAPKSAVLLVLSLVLGVLYLKFKIVPVTGDYLLKIILGIALLGLLFTATGRLKIGNKLSLFLGTISYEVYIIHIDVFSLVERTGLQMKSGVYILLSLLITVALAAVIQAAARPIVGKLRR